MSAAQGDPYADKSVAEMEQEIARTRDTLGEDLDALAWQLSPERFKGHAQASVDRAQGAVMDGMQEASTTLSERAREGGSSVVGVLQRHRLPVTLVSLGLAVLATAGGAEPRRPRNAASGTRVGATYVAAAPGSRPADGADYGSGPDVGAAAVSRGRRKRGRGLGNLMDKYPTVAGATAVLAGMAVSLTLSGTGPEREASGRSASSSDARTDPATESTLGRMPTRVIRGKWSS